MEAELKRLFGRAFEGRAPRPRRADPETLLYPYDDALAWLCTHYLRTPSRVFRDLLEAPAERLEPLYADILSWAEGARPGWLLGARSLSVDVRGLADFPAGPLQIRGAVKNALFDAARAAGRALELDPENPDAVVVAHGRSGAVLLSLDLGGAMHARGYRLDGGEAPLRETLAAQMLLLARFDPRSDALVDPMCGAGTIPIEAAMSAIGAPLWVPPRAPPLDRLPGLAAPRLESAGESGELFPGADPPIVGIEIHTPAYEAFARNLGRAGANGRVLALHGDFRSFDLAALARRLAKAGVRHDLARGLVVSNPPYGVRTGARGDREGDLGRLYGDLRAWCHALPEGWRFAFLSADPAFEDTLGAEPVMKKPMPNGPIRAWLTVYDRI